PRSQAPLGNAGRRSSASRFPPSVGGRARSGASPAGVTKQSFVTRQSLSSASLSPASLSSAFLCVLLLCVLCDSVVRSLLLQQRLAGGDGPRVGQQLRQVV